jgi:Mn2+/Fe2+ NRAMP family transporter
MEQRTGRSRRGAVLGAAFLMAASAVGPGFLIQTSRFSAEGGMPFFYAILFVTLADIVTKANIWSVVGASGMTGAQLADGVQKGLGTALTVMIVFGGLAFNVGNIGGAALGLSALCGLPERIGALVGGLLAAMIFCFGSAKCIVDRLAVILSAIIVAVVLAVCIRTQPPLLKTVTTLPQLRTLPGMFFPLITLLGGACGGYIPFSGAHRLLETGERTPASFRRAAVLGASVSGLIRLLLFFCVIGACCAGRAFLSERAAAIAGADNPAAQTFYLAAGEWGKRLFGVLLLCAGLACTVGAAYTSVTFLRTLHPFLARHERACILGMIGVSVLILLIFGRASTFAVLAGTVNGFVLPLSLTCILLASGIRSIVGEYRHPLPLTIAGWIVAALSAMLAVRSLLALFA